MSLSRAEVNSFLHNPVDIGSGITADYVVAHAKRQERKGKQPSASYKGINNPRQALEAAHADIKARYDDPQRMWDGVAQLSGRVVVLNVIIEQDVPLATKFAEKYIAEDGAVGANIEVGEPFNLAPRRPLVTDSGVVELPLL